jgi:hypothetical protein
MPVLIMTPDITAETWDGATGCARGNQMWSGNAPAFVAKPTSKSTSATSRATGAMLGAATCQAAKSSPPPALDASNAKPIRIAAVATCVIAKYRLPAAMTVREGRNPTTSSAESRAIDSQAMRNENALLAPRTSKMLPRNSGYAQPSIRDRGRSPTMERDAAVAERPRATRKAPLSPS